MVIAGPFVSELGLCSKNNLNRVFDWASDKILFSETENLRYLNSRCAYLRLKIIRLTVTLSGKIKEISESVQSFYKKRSTLILFDSDV